MCLTVNGRLIRPRPHARVPSSRTRVRWCTMSQRDFGAEHEIDSVVRGHHAYKAVWKPVEGEILRLSREHCNKHDSSLYSSWSNSSISGNFGLRWNFTRLLPFLALILSSSCIHRRTVFELRENIWLSGTSSDRWWNNNLLPQLLLSCIAVTFFRSALNTYSLCHLVDQWMQHVWLTRVRTGTSTWVGGALNKWYFRTL